MDLAATLRTRRLYDFMSVLKSFAASGLAGLFGFGSVSSDWMLVSIVDVV